VFAVRPWATAFLSLLVAHDPGCVATPTTVFLAGNAAVGVMNLAKPSRDSGDAANVPRFAWFGWTIDEAAQDLGAAPTRCRMLPGSGRYGIGILVETSTSTVLRVMANGPADVGGLEPGNAIVTINGERVGPGIQGMELLWAAVGRGEPVEIGTSAGVSVVTPRIQSAGECVWDTTVPPRSCRVLDGLISECQRAVTTPDAPSSVGPLPSQPQELRP
jgi:hypothetical protein